jgi:hypothetical protein
MRGWRATHAFVDLRSRGRDRVSDRLRAHVITAMYSSADERAANAGHERNGCGAAGVAFVARALKAAPQEQLGPCWLLSQKTKRGKRNIGGEFEGNDNAS